MNIILNAVRRWYRGLLYRGVAVQELTAAFAVKSLPNAALESTLAQQDARLAEEYADAERDGNATIRSYSVPGLHSFRWTLIAPTEQNVTGKPAKRASSLLLLSIVFDGDLEDVLAGLFERMQPQLREVLQHCQGSQSTNTLAGFIAYVSGARVQSGYFFKDAGPLLPGDGPGLDATRTEMEEALRLSEQFHRFYARHRLDRPEQLREAFLEFCGTSVANVGFPLPLSKFETALQDEQRWIRRVVELTLRLQDRNARAESGHRRRRVAHTKHHGFLRAKFKIAENLPAPLRRGIFRELGQEFDALLRTSNTFETRRSDGKRDGRGLSIKVLDVGNFGSPVVAEEPMDPSAATINQDFLLLSNPTFFASNIRDFTLFRSLLDVRGKGRALALVLFALAHSKELWILAKTLLSLPGHPFALQYHSVTASLLGPDRAVKYFVKAKDEARFRRFKVNRSAENYLGDALRRSLQEGSAVLEFYIHAPPEPNGIEDATVDWNRKSCKPVLAATITIPPQDPTTATALERGETTEFNPWNALADHRPLGSISRGRLAIYRASAGARRMLANASKQPLPPIEDSATLPPPSPAPHSTELPASPAVFSSEIAHRSNVRDPDQPVT